jgi:hypothetical protein
MPGGGTAQISVEHGSDDTRQRQTFDSKRQLSALIGQKAVLLHLQQFGNLLGIPAFRKAQGALYKVLKSARRLIGAPFDQCLINVKVGFYPLGIRTSRWQTRLLGQRWVK